jgi:hypothetical protein
MQRVTIEVAAAARKARPSVPSDFVAFDLNGYERDSRFAQFDDDRDRSRDVAAILTDPAPLTGGDER